MYRNGKIAEHLFATVYCLFNFVFFFCLSYFSLSIQTISGITNKKCDNDDDDDDDDEEDERLEKFEY